MNKILFLLVSLVAMASFSAIVSASLTVSATSPKPVIDVGQNTTVIANVTGGNGNYTCLWSYYSLAYGGTPVPFGGTQCSTLFYGNTSTFATQPDVVLVNANDSIGDTGSGSTIVALYRPLNATITPSTATIYVNNSVTVSTYIYGGRPQYAWSFFETPTAGVSETSTTSNGLGSVTTFYFTQPGVYDISEVIGDVNQNYITVSSLITVLPPTPPLKVSIYSPSSHSATNATVELGQSVELLANGTGGVPPYTYEWFVNGVENSTSSSNMYTFTPATSSPYTIYVIATDSSKATSSSTNFTVVVDTHPSIAISPSSAVITAGKSIVFVNATSGGIPPYSYSYTVPGGVVQNGNGFTFPNSGNYVITETVVDSQGFSASSESIITVTPPLQPLQMSLTPQSSTIYAGQSVRLTNVTTGGQAPYYYSYSVPAGVSESGNNFTFPSTGTYVITEKVTDQLSGTATNSSTVVVQSKPIKYYSCSSGTTTNIVINSSNYAKYKSLAYSASKISVNVQKLVSGPLTVAISGSYDCLSLNSVGGGAIQVSTSGSYYTQYVYSLNSSKAGAVQLSTSGSYGTQNVYSTNSVTLQLSGSYDSQVVSANTSTSFSLSNSGSHDTLGLALGTGGQSVAMSGSYDVMNLTNNGGSLSLNFPGSYETLGLRTVASGTISTTSTGSNSNVYTTDGTVSGNYQGSYNKLNFKNERVTSITCTSGGHNTITAVNTTIVSNKCT